MTNGELMQKLFTKDELSNVDVAIPMGWVEYEDQYWFVMDYNDGSVFGTLVDMRERAKKMGVKID